MGMDEHPSGQKFWIAGSIAILAVGAGAGYWYGRSVGVAEERARAQLAAKEVVREAAQSANPFNETAVNPFAENPANPFANIQLNPFK